MKNLIAPRLSGKLVYESTFVSKEKFSAMSIIVYLPLDNLFVLSDTRKVFIKFFYTAKLIQDSDMLNWFLFESKKF